MNKNIKVLLVIIFLTVLVGTFVFNPIMKRLFSGFNQNNIYNNDKIIAGSADSYSYLSRQGQVKDNVAELSFQLTGVDTIWSFSTTESKNMTLHYDIKIKQGQFKVVLVNANKEVITLLEEEGKDSIDFSLEPGKNVIKIVGKKALVELYLKIDE